MLYNISKIVYGPHGSVFDSTCEIVPCGVITGVPGALLRSTSGKLYRCIAAPAVWVEDALRDFTFDPNGTADGAVFTTLDTLAQAVAAAPLGRKTVSFRDSSGTGAYTIANGSLGPYDFGECEFLGVLGEAPNFALSITFGTGVVFSHQPTRFAGTNLFFYLPAGFWTATAAATFIELDGASIGPVNGIAVAPWAIPAGLYVFCTQKNLGQLFGDPSATGGLVSIEVGSLLATYLYNGCIAGNYIVTGTGTFGVTCVDGVQTAKRQTLAGWSGTWTVTTLTRDDVVLDRDSPVGGNTATTWTTAYYAALSQAGDVSINVVGTANTILTSAGSTAWDLSRIKLYGAPGTVLTIAAGADLSPTTKIEVSGGLVLRIAADVVVAPMLLTSGSTTRRIYVRDTSFIEVLSTTPFLSTSAGYSGDIALIGSGDANTPMVQGAVDRPFATLGGTGTLRVSGNRPIQAQLHMSGGTSHAGTQVLLTGRTLLGGTTRLTDVLANAFIRLPQYATISVSGRITARSEVAGSTATGVWSFEAVFTRNALVSSVVSVSSTVSVVSAGTFGTPPQILTDTTNGGLYFLCTGDGSTAAQWTAVVNLCITGAAN